MYNKHTRHNNQGNDMMKKTNRSPYEIRADLLVLAKEILIEQSHAKATRTGIAIVAPTTAEIVAEAKILNQFVSLDDKT